MSLTGPSAELRALAQGKVSPVSATSPKKSGQEGEGKMRPRGRQVSRVRTGQLGTGSQGQRGPEAPQSGGHRALP